MSTRTYKEMLTDYHATIDRITDLTWAGYMRNPYGRLYLIGHRSHPSAVWDRFDVVPDTDDREGWWPVRPEPLPRHLPIEVLRNHIKDILKTEPLRIFAN
jgi:hypothetical protein